MKIRLWPLVVIASALIAIVPGAANAPAPAAVPAPTQADLSTIKLMNYYPSAAPWNLMWSKWNPTVIQNDFATIKSMGANAVRLIVQSYAFGYPTPSTTMKSRLASAIGYASAAGLRVQLTLFDGFSAYTDLNGSHQWASRLLGSYVGDSRIAFVEIQNEINPYNSDAMAWARNMVPYVRSLVRLPIAASSSGDINWWQDFVNAFQNKRPDIFSFHFYRAANLAYSDEYWAQRIASPTPIIVGETGYSTGTTGSSPSDPTMETDQRTFFWYAEDAARYLNLPAAAPWTLWDFVDGSCTCYPGTQYHFGLLRVDGSTKPAFDLVQQYFQTGTLPPQ